MKIKSRWMAVIRYATVTFPIGSRMMSRLVFAACTCDFVLLVSINAFMFHFNEPRLEKTAELVNYIVQFLSFLNLIFYASRRLLRLYNTIFDGPGRKPQIRQPFSRRGDGFENYKAHVCMFFFTFVILISSRFFF